MNYLKGLFSNFLLVFFVNYLLPGIEVANITKLPHIGADLIFAAVLGFLNGSIYYGLKVFRQDPSILKIALIALILNFTAYAVVKFIPIGVHVAHLDGYLLAASGVGIGSFILNFLEMRKHKAPPPDLFQ
jgi:uncharacterized membrane protein YvlD (DUF360 family)